MIAGNGKARESSVDMSMAFAKAMHSFRLALSSGSSRTRVRMVFDDGARDEASRRRRSRCSVAVCAVHSHW